jgi:hypothetical protein
MRMVFCSSREIVSLKFVKRLAGAPVYYSRSNEPSLAPQFKWLENAFKGIDRPFGGGVESILIQSVFVNWRLENFFYLILNGLHHKISKKLLYAA